jgi:hypothetical protein
MLDRLRRAALAPWLLGAALLAGCATTSDGVPVAASPSSSGTQRTSTPPSREPSSSEPEVPDPTPSNETTASAAQALITVSALATAPNGAQVRVSLTLDSLPAADRDLLDEVLAACYLKDNNWPPDVGRAVLWEQTLRSVPVPGTPRWPAKQELFLLTLAAQGVASGDGFVQLRTTSGAKAMCSSPDANIRPRGPGTIRLVLLTSPSRALAGAGPDEILAIGQYGFATGFSPKLASTLSDCDVRVAPEVESIRARVGQPWRTFDSYAPWDDGDYCGIGVPNEEIP